MLNYLPLVKVLNGIEKENPSILREVDKQELINHDSKVIGITGPPGAGKSTLLSDMVNSILGDGEKVAVLLIDPTDPRTKGAFLGDRIRFNNLPIHPNLFIRSVASREFLGGVSLYTPLYIKAFVQFGFSKIFIETVGAGQSEMDIYTVADTSLYVTSPDIGDSMQVLKGGSMNNFDILVINKSDLSGADRTETLLRRNANILGSKQELRIVKHRKGRDTSLKEIFDNIHETLGTESVTHKRRELVKYYQKNILFREIEKLLEDKFRYTGQNGANTIRDAKDILDRILREGK